MLRYVVHRLMLMIPTLFVISVLVFVIIQLPPGDYLSSMIAELEAQGDRLQREQIEYLRAEYGLDQPLWRQYLAWVGGLLQGDMGYSFEYQLPVSEVVGDRIWMTILISVVTILFIYVVSFPIAIYSATHQYSPGDYTVTFLGFLGLATPNFLLALILLFLANRYLGIEIGGLMADEFVGEPLSVDKVLSVLAHMWIPVIVIGTAGTAGMIRRLRANLLDELNKPYFVTARAKGLPYHRAVRKYPLRVAVNPFIADIGSILPDIIGGEVLVSIIFQLPTTGPLLLRALQSQDMYLAGSFLMLLAVLTVVGMLLSDLALAWLDPRIRFGAGR